MLDYHSRFYIFIVNNIYTVGNIIIIKMATKPTFCYLAGVYLVNVYNT